tara:strand:+ start:2641 stop:3306 length:666 start_codon:yes stop_codon:yes gene_type:complete
MDYKIDLDKLQSVCKSIFYDENHTRELGTKPFQGVGGWVNVSYSYLTMDGILMTNSNNLLDKQGDKIFIMFGEHSVTAMWCIWKYIKNNPTEEENVRKLFNIQDDMLRESDEKELFTSQCTVYWKLEKRKLYKDHRKITRRFLEVSKMCRVNIINLHQIKKSSFNKGTAIPDKINIQSYHPFTEQQISFILGYQKKYNIKNTHLTIDDRTEDNCLKEQLNL